MEVYWFETLESTQSYLIDSIKKKNIPLPVCVVADIQTMGKGSRGNSWIGKEGNLFMSLGVPRRMLPDDLKLESCSIYFAFLLKEYLSQCGSKVWLKWPNDFYLGDVKIGGVITNLAGETLVCGIGMNLDSAPEDFGKIDIRITPHEVVSGFCGLFEKLPEWKQIFSKYQLEFEHSRRFNTHIGDSKIKLEMASLCEDGSLEYDGQRIFSLR